MGRVKDPNKPAQSRASVQAQYRERQARYLMELQNCGNAASSIHDLLFTAKSHGDPLAEELYRQSRNETLLQVHKYLEGKCTAKPAPKKRKAPTKSKTR